MIDDKICQGQLWFSLLLEIGFGSVFVLLCLETRDEFQVVELHMIRATTALCDLNMGKKNIRLYRKEVQFPHFDATLETVLVFWFS